MPGESAAVRATCCLLKAGEGFIGKQGLQYNVAISAETAGSKALHMQLVTIPPGGRARAHKHATHETAIYALSGASGMWYGERLEHHVVVEPGNWPTCRTCRITRARPTRW
jgi:uncharacterized RmlC-like cupin family protein